MRKFILVGILLVLLQLAVVSASYAAGPPWGGPNNYYPRYGNQGWQMRYPGYSGYYNNCCYQNYQRSYYNNCCYQNYQRSYYNNCPPRYNNYYNSGYRNYYRAPGYGYGYVRQPWYDGRYNQY